MMKTIAEYCLLATVLLHDPMLGTPFEAAGPRPFRKYF